MDKQVLQERIAQINAEMMQLKSTYSQLEGHLKEANHWLMELITKEAQDELLSQGEDNGQANVVQEEQSPVEPVCAAEGEEVSNS